MYLDESHFYREEFQLTLHTMILKILPMSRTTILRYSHGYNQVYMQITVKVFYDMYNLDTSTAVRDVEYVSSTLRYNIAQRHT